MDYNKESSVQIVFYKKMKSGKFDTPTDFNIDLKFGANHIKYLDLVEVAQGGPRIGRLFINGETIPNYQFTGPFLYTNEFIFIPAFIKSAFIIAKIRLSDRTINFLGESTDIICLEKIEGENIFYYNSLDQIYLKKYDLSEYRLTNDKDTPIDFETKFKLKHNTIEYTNLKFIKKHLANIGSLLINGKAVPNYRFGGPFLYNNSSIIIPVYFDRLLQSGFKIALIHLEDNSIQIKGKIKKTIQLAKVKNNGVFFYADTEKRELDVMD